MKRSASSATCMVFPAKISSVSQFQHQHVVDLIAGRAIVKVSCSHAAPGWPSSQNTPGALCSLAQLLQKLCRPYVNGQCSKLQRSLIIVHNNSDGCEPSKSSLTGQTFRRKSMLTCGRIPLPHLYVHEECMFSWGCVHVLLRSDEHRMFADFGCIWRYAP